MTFFTPPNDFLHRAKVSYFRIFIADDEFGANG